MSIPFQKGAFMMKPLRIALKVLIAAAIISPAVGCSFPPASAPWREKDRVIAPKASEPVSSRGQLVVETAVTGNAENGRIPHAPYYVYDSEGRSLDRFPNEYLFPVPFKNGHYVIVSKVSGDYHKVQVEIRDGMTTVVTVRDFKEAPVAE